MPNRWQRRSSSGPPTTTAGRPSAHELLDARVVEPQVDDEHAVDAMLAPPAPVDRDLLLDVLDELDRQRDRRGRELRLDAGDELHEERLERERAGRPGEHEPAGVGTCGRERARRAVRVPAELVGDREDPVARVVGDARAGR